MGRSIFAACVIVQPSVDVTVYDSLGSFGFGGRLPSAGGSGGVQSELGKAHELWSVSVAGLYDAVRVWPVRGLVYVIVCCNPDVKGSRSTLYGLIFCAE